MWMLLCRAFDLRVFTSVAVAREDEGRGEGGDEGGDAGRLCSLAELELKHLSSLHLIEL